MAGPFGITQVDVPGILEAYSQRQRQGLEDMYRQKQMARQDKMDTRADEVYNRGEQVRTGLTSAVDSAGRDAVTRTGNNTIPRIPEQIEPLPGDDAMGVAAHGERAAGVVGPGRQGAGLGHRNARGVGDNRIVIGNGFRSCGTRHAGNRRLNCQRAYAHGPSSKKAKGRDYMNGLCRTSTVALAALICASV